MRARGLWGLLVGLAVLGASPAKPAPKWRGEWVYEAGRFPPKNWAKQSDAQLGKGVLDYFKTWGVTRVDRVLDDDERQQIWSSDAGTSLPLNRWEKIALYRDMEAALMGGELDTVVESDAGAVPISVYWDAEHTVALKTGPAFRPDLTPQKATDVRSRYGVGAFEDGDAKWDDRAVGLVAQALASLDAVELALIKNVRFIRKHEGGRMAAQYGCSPSEGGYVFLYDSAFARDDTFVGDPLAPRSSTVWVLLHELGHAVADTRVRELATELIRLKQAYDETREASNGLIAAFNARVKQHDDAAVLGPLKTQVEASLVEVRLSYETARATSERLSRIEREDKSAGHRTERAFAQVLDPSKAPTDYGRKNAVESFAESYALFKTDPAALERAAPGALAWFKTKEYLRLANQPLE